MSGAPYEIVVWRRTKPHVAPLHDGSFYFRPKKSLSFFGIRGLGTVYYLAFAMGHATFERMDLLWATAGLAVLISILLHGITVTPVLRALDRRMGPDTESAQLDLTLPRPTA